jgi:autotransporter adhesin (fragment)
MKKTKKFNPSLKTISYSIAAIMAGTLASQNAQAVVNINSSTDYSDNLTVSKMKNIADQQAKDALATARLYDVIKEIAKDPSLSQSTKDYIANNLPSDDVLSNGSTFKLYTSKGSQKTATVDSEPLVRLGAGSTIPLTADNNVDTENVDTIGRNDFVSRFSNFAGKTSDGVVSVGDKASGKYRTITNVSAGRLNFDSTDAVNGSQLHSTNVALDYLANKFKNDMFSITTNQVENGHSSEFDSYNVNHVQSGSVINYKEGKNISINYSQSSTPDHSEAMNPEPNPLHNIVIKTKDDLVANSYTVTGQNGKNDAVLNNDGLNMGNRTISNLKDGVQDNDAVNVSQLNKVKKQLDGIGTGGNATGDVYFSDNTGKKHMLL